MRNTPLYQQIEDTFIEQIKSGSLKDGDRIPSESEIVEMYHVSMITAKRALNSLADNGYALRIQGKGTFVHVPQTQRSSFLIGILFTTLATDIDKELLDHLERYARKSGMRFLFGLSRESVEEENRIIEEFRNSGTDGVIIFPTVSETYNNAIIKLFLERFPLVLIDRYFKKMDIPSVVSNNFDGGYQLAKLMFAHGASKLCFISTKEENSATLDRQMGIEEAFIEQGIPTNKNDWLFVPSDVQDAAEIEDFLNQVKPDCIMTVNAHLAGLANHYVHEHDVLHLSFDASNGSDYYVRQNPEGIADMAIHLLRKSMTGERTESHNILVPITVNAGTRQKPSR
ncbi:GntR family transcriptional regulator [Bifidobacterium sp. SO4]|uniref:GntR family transcriptional regulator n=1 Tax=Bifidobacterium sp. SO4 TaxID=2809030 RepID=UPI001BDBEB38|nr:GntR family transcriptional regulator [Bifidobacterium sp. SO4]MBT1170628.1 GntR family transcriptional regulator [Bifidobacterium sp. SO4]